MLLKLYIIGLFIRFSSVKTGEIAARAIIDDIKNIDLENVDEHEETAYKTEAENFLTEKNTPFTAEQLEEAMQTVMDSYAGGIKTSYRFNEKQLEIADEKIKKLFILSEELYAKDLQELMHIYELRERLIVCRSVIAHLKARKETRWHSFAENLDYPKKSDDFKKYINSKFENGEIKIIYRDLIKEGEDFEHFNR